MSNEQQALRVLLYKDDEHWVAQGLDLDLCAFGKDLAAAIRRFDEVCELEISTRKKRFGDEHHGLKRAPQRFFDLWEKSGPTLFPEPNGCDFGIRLAA